MNENMRDGEMNRRQCDRTEELVAYLYGEASAAEAESFTQHLSVCASCRDELSAFGAVREAVGAWRAEALSVSPSLTLADASAAATSPSNPFETRARKRSALAALHEFFTLSPLWLQAGSVAATILVCALAALTVARTEVRWDAGGVALRAGVRDERVVEKRVEVPVPVGFSQEQVDRMVAARVSELEAKLEQLQANGQTDFATASASSQNRPSPRTTVVASNKTGRQGRGNVISTPQREREFIAATNRDDEDLPRLSDLLREVN
jgi:hypothetical protein